MATRRAFLGYLGAFGVLSITAPSEIVAPAIPDAAAPAPAAPPGFDYAAELGRLSDPLPEIFGWSEWQPAPSAGVHEFRPDPAKIVPGTVIIAELPGLPGRTFRLTVVDVIGDPRSGPFRVHHRMSEITGGGE